MTEIEADNQGRCMSRNDQTKLRDYFHSKQSANLPTTLSPCAGEIPSAIPPLYFSGGIMDYKSMSKEDLVCLIIQCKDERVSDPKGAISEIRKVKIRFNQENVILLILDNANHVLKRRLMFKGGINESTIDLKVVFRETFKTSKAAGIILAHNHPSGSLTPSKEDIAFTTRCRDACKVVGLHFLDSIVFTETRSLSLREEGYLSLT
jgi:nitrate reductase NapAB chaperone NapD